MRDVLTRLSQQCLPVTWVSTCENINVLGHEIVHVLLNTSCFHLLHLRGSRKICSDCYERRRRGGGNEFERLGACEGMSFPEDPSERNKRVTTRERFVLIHQLSERRHVSIE